MALGDQSKMMKIWSRAKGWDPDKIEGSDVNMADFDPEPEPWSSKGYVGKLPSIPENQVDFTGVTDAALGESVPWQAPEIKTRTEGKPSSSDPYPGSMEG